MRREEGTQGEGGRRREGVREVSSITYFPWITRLSPQVIQAKTRQDKFFISDGSY